MSKQSARSTGLVPQITRAQVEELAQGVEEYTMRLKEYAEGCGDDGDHVEFMKRISACDQVMRHLWERIRWQESGE